MKSKILGSALLIMALSACGSGGANGSAPGVLPSIGAAAVATAPPVEHAQALDAPTQPNGSPLPYIPVIVPANGILYDAGEAFTLASPVPVYNLGSTQTVQFTFGPNSGGVPVAALVGTTTTAVNVLLSSADGSLIHPFLINGKTNIWCIMHSTNSVGYPGHTGAPGTTDVQYFACAGNPFI